MMLFCPYITFTIVSLCQWNTIASYSKCLLVIRRCLKLYPVSMSVRCDIDLTVIFKSCRTLYCLSIPIPFIMPNRLTGAPYLALGNYAIHAYLIYLTHVPYIMMAVHQTPLSCSLPIYNRCSREHPFIQHHHLYILNYTILNFICQVLFLLFFPRFYTQSECRKIHQITMRQ